MERWIMNRIGFVNFWVYDIEEFPFKDGKLLLRGSNGSGKSITTQSFIPYILDGDRQPSRLDPFGSKDRKMEYYLIGDSDSGKDESIGYLFLEFKKPQSGQYRTIGIGLHAKKGSKMNTWGFCILDGRRVGHNFMLYREVGSENIPYSSKQLKELLGDNNLYVEKISDYKAMVAKQIFDIDSENISDFQQLTNILIKTRSSKLASKENLKPEQLYTVLNESLQTLSDEELRPMADAMTKIDETHKKIEDGQGVLREIKYITAEYDRYNKYMLWKKADKYLKKNNSTSTIQNKVYELNDRIQQNIDDKASAEKRLGEAKIKETDLECEKAALNYDNIETHIENKNKAKKALDSEKVKFENKQKQLSEKREKIDLKYRTLKSDRFRLDDILYEIKKQINAFNEYSDFVPILHNSYIKGITTDDRYFEQSEQCRKEIDSYSKKLQEILNLIRERDRIKADLDLSEKFCDNAKKTMQDNENELKVLRKMLDDEKDKIIEDFYIAA
ncbi:MAG: TIGR02680 family protein, partial [Oscillospiraceae bacterium]